MKRALLPRRESRGVGNSIALETLGGISLDSLKFVKQLANLMELQTGNPRMFPFMK